jgi:hypothetical protein
VASIFLTNKEAARGKKIKSTKQEMLGKWRGIF